nr:hypothetical protein [Tanacetum cinerariifolium]
MAALKYKEEHNKVGYLLKPTGSDDYHQIIDFLSESHIMYALTSNPIIFDFLVKQFWSTATIRESELGPPAILATIDKTPYTITEALVKEKQETDKIETKPDKNGKRGKARQCRRPITVKKAEKRRKYKVQGTKDANPESCINSR